MLTLLRFVSFLLGCAITVAPTYLTLAFAYGVGEPPETAVAFAFYLLPLAIGLIFGIGPLMIGCPKLVAGPQKPRMRVAAGTFLAISIAGVLMLGFGGSVTRVVTPIALLVEAVLFAVFIWPAKNFPANLGRCAIKPHSAGDFYVRWLPFKRRDDRRKLQLSLLQIQAKP